MPDTLPSPPPSLLARPISLFLDFDGTLVAIADRHDSVVIDPSLPALLAALAGRLGGRLAVVSGRPVDEIVALILPEGGKPAYAVAGSHGMELRRPDGRHVSPETPETLEAAVTRLKDFADTAPGVVVEEKPLGVAIHYRLAPEQAAETEAVARDVAAGSGLSLQKGKMVCELRAEGADKGDAVRLLMAEPPMAGTHPVFIGDDLTDEAGFAAARALGGAGILVGNRPGETAATHALPDVAAVHGWLAALAGAEA